MRGGATHEAILEAFAAHKEDHYNKEDHRMKTLRIPFLVLLMAALTFAAMVTLFAQPVQAAEVAFVDETQSTATPYSWEQLATIPGAIAATLLIVQYLKLPLDKVWKIPTRFMVLIIAFCLMAGAQATIRGLTWPDVPLVAINAFVVALAAMGAYELTYAKKNANATGPGS
jgi:uncharacterized BrkB/YihY/UPF0761 family membrane protein